MHGDVPGSRRPQRARGPSSRTALAVAALVAVACAVFVVYLQPGQFAGGGRAEAVANAGHIVRAQRAVGLDVEQRVIASPLGRGWIGSAMSWTYALGYWPTVVGAIAFTAWRDRARWRLYRNGLAISGAIGVVVFTLWPVAPPRLSSDEHDPVVSHPLAQSIAHPSGIFNEYAAMPSFHVAWTLLAALAVAPLVRWRWVPLSVPAAMCIAVVTTANHWIADVLAGIVVALVARAAAPALQRAFDRHRQRRFSRRHVGAAGP